MPDTIVYIEDNPDDRALTLQWLQRYGISNKVEMIDDGIKALNWIDSMTEEPLMIILDLGLPGVDGVELLRYLKSTLNTYDIPVIILTGSANEQDRVRSRVIDGNGYLTKPLRMISFFEELARLGFCMQICRKAK